MDMITTGATMSILLSGDLHGTHDISKLSSQENFLSLGIDRAEVSHLICLGDWGVIWNQEPRSTVEEARLIAWYEAMPWETLVILGNHEGYDRIAQLPWTERYSAPVRQVSDRIFILQHGNVYTLDGKRFFVFGGAMSTDRDQRIPGEEWWPQEIPTHEDSLRGIRSLAKVHGGVDYVLTHTCPLEMAEHFVEIDSIFLDNTKQAFKVVDILNK